MSSKNTLSNLSLSPSAIRFPILAPILENSPSKKAVILYNKSDLKDAFSKNKIEKIKEELADVVNYCILMADACGLDLDEIVQAKIEKNNEKYPVEKSKGKSDKYDKL